MPKRNEFLRTTAIARQTDVLPTRSSGSSSPDKAGITIRLDAVPKMQATWSFRRLSKQVGGLVAGLFSW